MFAAANANLVQLYSTFSFENTVNLKGHNGKVYCTVISMLYMYMYSVCECTIVTRITYSIIFCSNVISLIIIITT